MSEMVYQNNSRRRRASDEKVKLAKQQTTGSAVGGVSWPPPQFTALSLFKVLKNTYHEKNVDHPQYDPVNLLKTTCLYAEVANSLR